MKFILSLGIFVFVILFLVSLVSKNIFSVFSHINQKQTVHAHTTLLLGGDVMLGRSVTTQSLDVNSSARYPFIHIEHLFQSSDIVFVNLETPITNDCPRTIEGMIFCAPSRMLDGLPQEKTVVNLSNNHTKNYGQNGFDETLINLGNKHISYTGNNDLLIREVNGMKFGFLGFDYDQQKNPLITDKDKVLIINSRKKVDILIISLHWGIEYQQRPTTAQRQMAQELVSLGADVIVGHHPHVIQDTERIGETPVYYSLGNLVFDQMWSEETRKGLMVKLTFEDKKLVNEELIPIYMKNFAQPQIVKE